MWEQVWERVVCHLRVTSCDITTHLRAAAALRPGETVETQERGAGRHLPGRVAEERAGALTTAREWSHRDTVWTGGLRPDSGEVGAACVWRSPSGWLGYRFHLGMNNEVFGAEFFAIYQALRDVDRRRGSGHLYTAFVDSTAVSTG